MIKEVDLNGWGIMLCGVGSGLGERGWLAWVDEGHISNDSTQGLAKRRSSVHKLLLYGTDSKSATVHLTGRMRMGLALHWTPLCLERLLNYYYWHSCVVVNVSKGLSPEIEMGGVLTDYRAFLERYLVNQKIKTSFLKLSFYFLHMSCIINRLPFGII
jgi:hypothetical protein